MYTEEQIRKILSEKIKIFEGATADKKQPEYTGVYKDSVDFYEKISIHSEIGKFPEKIFSQRAPNQTPAEFEYMKSNFETTTYPIWTRFIGVSNRMWNDQNWSISWDRDSKDGQEYLETKYPIYESLEAFYKSIVTKEKIKDANAVVCHKPYELPVKDDGEGGLKIDDTKLVEPIAAIYNSPQVIGYKEGKYAMIELSEKSLVQYGNKTEMTGRIFEFYDEENIWKIIQKGKKIDYEFDVLIYWPHKLGYLPVKKLMGESIQRETEVLYQSKFMAAIGPMNLILLDSSYLQAAKTGNAFPHKWEYVDECDFSNGIHTCISGKIMQDGKPLDCPSCGGSGYRSKTSVLGVTQIKVPKGTASDEKISAPFVGWEAPNPEILTFLRSEIEKNEQIALSILNLNVSNSDVKGNETALGMKIDREEMMSAIQGISDEVFTLYDFSHKCILQMRYGVDYKLPSISYPKTFSIRSESDLTEEIANAKANGLPEVAIRKLIFEFMSTRFNGQDQAEKAFKIAAIADRLLTLSSLEVAQKKLSGSIANYEDILHTSFYTFIDELALDPKFFDKDIMDQKKMVVDMAKAKDLEISPKRLNTDSILANVNSAA